MKTLNAEIRVTGRHMQLTEAVKRHAVSKLESVGLDFPRILDAHIVLNVERHVQSCSILTTCSRHIRIQAVAEAANMYVAIDECIDKLARRMRKMKTRVKDHDRNPRVQRATMTPV